MRTSLLALMLFSVIGCTGDPGDTDDTDTPDCTVASDCDTPSSECMEATCDDGVCGEAPVEAGTVLDDPTEGDCQRAVCDGAGGVTSAADNTDVPADTECSEGVCVNGTADYEPFDEGTVCGAGDANVCDGEGECVECLVADDCPGTDDECQQRTCDEGTCGMDYTAADTPITAQTEDDCATAVCDGSGDVIQAAAPTDKPSDTDCATYTCDGVDLETSFANIDSDCGTGQFCDGAGECVDCNEAAQCPDWTGEAECGSAVCTGTNTCDFAFENQGTALTSQTEGDCQQVVCDGSGGTASVDADDPPNGGDTECATYICSDGTPQTMPKGPDTTCDLVGTDDGVCSDSEDACQECVTTDHCDTTGDNTCRTTECSDSGTCVTDDVAEGEPALVQTAGDCVVDVCAGDGSAPTAEADETDEPDDTNCTLGLCEGDCTTGENCTPASLDLDAGDECLIDNGVCTTEGECVECVVEQDCAGTPSDLPEGCEVGVCNLESNTCELEFVPSDCDPFIVSLEPDDGAEEVAVDASIVITFSEPIDVNTLTFAVEPGVCQGSIQISMDDLDTCVAVSHIELDDDTGSIVTVHLAEPMVHDRDYVIELAGTIGDLHGATLTDGSLTFFRTAPFEGECGHGVIISQVYGGGGNSGSPYNRDFVELFNTGPVPLSVDGWSVQYTSSSGSSWSNQTTALSGTIEPGSYFLVHLSGGSTGADLPDNDNDIVGGTNMSASNGKVALVSTTDGLPSDPCPLEDPSLVDLVGFGSANCSLGSGATGSGSNTNSVQRRYSGCQQTEDNAEDFVVASPFPRNSSSTTATCACAADIVYNGTGDLLEADYCHLEDAAVTTAPNSPAYVIDEVGVWGQLYDAEATAGQSEPQASTRAQVGYGPLGTDPRNQSGWVYFDANFGTVDTDDHYYEGFLIAPVATGTYGMTYRFSLNEGAGWTYCDTQGSGSTPDAYFTPQDLGTLTVE